MLCTITTLPSYSTTRNNLTYETSATGNVGARTLARAVPCSSTLPATLAGNLAGGSSMEQPH